MCAVPCAALDPTRTLFADFPQFVRASCSRVGKILCSAILNMVLLVQLHADMHGR
jgi:hypothetical protein